MEDIFILSELSGKELYEKAQIYKQNKDYDNHAICLVRSADYNYKLAQEVVFREEEFKLQNYSNTFKSYENAISINDKNSYSLTQLARMYHFGHGTQIDYSQARKLYLMAIEKGNDVAMNNFGNMCGKGYGMDKDSSMAFNYLNMSARKGNNMAMHTLGQMHENGEEVQRDFQKAKEFYEMSVMSGDQKAINDLINLYKKNIFDKDTVTNSLFKLNLLNELWTIYGYDSYCIKAIETNLISEKKIRKLKKKNAKMKLHILASPDGKLYFEAKKHWNENK